MLQLLLKCLISHISNMKDIYDKNFIKEKLKKQDVIVILLVKISKSVSLQQSSKSTNPLEVFLRSMRAIHDPNISSNRDQTSRISSSLSPLLFESAEIMAQKLANYHSLTNTGNAPPHSRGDFRGAPTNRTLRIPVLVTIYSVVKQLLDLSWDRTLLRVRCGQLWD